jgi:hypothetical protein
MGYMYKQFAYSFSESVCISSRNLIIANFSRCVRSLFSETYLTLYFYLNVIAPSITQAPLHQND